MKTCCGCILEELVKIIAIFDIVVASIITVFWLAAVTIGGELNLYYLGILIIVILGFLLEFYLFTILRSGAMNRDLAKCRRWCVIRILLLLVFVAVVVYQQLTTRIQSIQIATGGRVLWNIFELISVKRFVSELGEVEGEEEEEPPPAVSGMTINVPADSSLRIVRDPPPE